MESITFIMHEERAEKCYFVDLDSKVSCSFNMKLHD